MNRLSVSGLMILGMATALVAACGDDETTTGGGGGGMDATSSSTGGSSVGGSSAGGSNAGGSNAGGSNTGGSNAGGMGGAGGAGGGMASIMSVNGIACGNTISYRAPMDAIAEYGQNTTFLTGFTVHDGPSFDVLEETEWATYAQTHSIMSIVGFAGPDVSFAVGEYTTTLEAGLVGADGLGVIFFDEGDGPIVKVAAIDATSVKLSLFVNVLGYGAVYPPTAASFNACSQGAVEIAIEGPWSLFTP